MTINPCCCKIINGTITPFDKLRVTSNFCLLKDFLQNKFLLQPQCYLKHHPNLF
jgi:hypothetical protein